MPHTPRIVTYCSPIYKIWVEGFARSRRLMPQQLIDQALALLAQREGHSPPPPRLDKEN